ncbi:MAG: ribonuclease P protein component [Bacteroidetes bacterium]|nr:ribonuclease P protein component [Bacteroidota bacterium]
MSKRFTLGKKERLKSRKLIDQVFNGGRSFTFPPYKINYFYTQTPIGLQAGFGASTRNFGRAVDRNRIKRISREAYRLQKESLKKSVEANNKNLAVFFIYIGKELPVYHDAYKRMGSILEKLIQITDENNIAHT